MPTTTKSIDVNVPVRVAYNQWTQFESFPQFMDGVDEVKQLDDQHLHWKASVAGQTQEWDAEIVEQLPDKRVAWRSTSGDKNSGVVTFHHLSDSSSRVTVQLEFEPQGALQKAAEITGIMDLQVDNSLQHFKTFIEERGQATGSWRGEIDENRDQPSR